MEIEIEFRVCILECKAKDSRIRYVLPVRLLTGQIQAVEMLHSGVMERLSVTLGLAATGRSYQSVMCLSVNCQCSQYS